MMGNLFDPRCCQLGEGPLWHPEREQLFWFDILGRRMLSVQAGEQHQWQFEEHVSAAGWVDSDTLLIASETALFRFELGTGKQEVIAPLEMDNSETRSNDGRADRWGGFWIGTMGKSAEAGAGAIHRWYRGELETLFGAITIPNAICFSPDGSCAYFTDTPTRKILRQKLDDDGWPVGEPEVFVDMAKEALNPDGAVVDAEGCLWNAQWGASRVARYSAEGVFLSAVEFPAEYTSCPAFGGDDLTTLFATSATQGMIEPGPQEGLTYAIQTGIVGQKEHRVIL
jgi:sugar lactone lactonase YvrE